MIPQAAVETARFIGNPLDISPANPDGAVSISPDGRTYVFRLLRGEVSRNDVRVDIYRGSLASMDVAAHPVLVAHLYSTGLGGGVASYLSPVLDLWPETNPIRWLGNDRIAFLWSDGRGVRQVVMLELSNGALTTLTDHSTSIAAFDVSTKGDVLYNAAAYDGAAATSALRSDSHGMILSSTVDAYGILIGDLSGPPLIDRRMNTRWFLRRARDRSIPVVPWIEREDRDVRHVVAFAPDGRHAVFDPVPFSVPAGWRNYRDTDLASWVEGARTRPDQWMSRNVHQLYLLNVATGAAHPLLNAPVVAAEVKLAWSPDSRSVLCAPCFLPADTSDADRPRSGRAAIVDVQSGRAIPLPFQIASNRTVSGVRWDSSSSVEIWQRDGTSTEIHRFVRTERGWGLAATHGPGVALPLGVVLTIEQDVRTPPRLYAVDRRSGGRRLVLDPNPDLVSSYALGRAQRREGRVDIGLRWTGSLFYPPNFIAGHRYPLVIQSAYGQSTDGVFSLYGDAIGTGPSAIAAYGGRLLANQGMFVLHMNLTGNSGFGTEREGDARRRAFEDAAEQLVAAGLVDRERVGLLGFSRNGYYVEYTLTHSDFPFAAAVAADNWDPSYFQQTLLGYGTGAEMVNGGEAFGEGLSRWLRNAPGFNIEHNRTPLRLIIQSSGRFGVLTHWENFNRLRYLNRPVELYVMPQAEAHGAHNSQNPRQIIAVQQGVIDWFRFWLQDYEDPDPAKVEQYARWRAMRSEWRRQQAWEAAGHSVGSTPSSDFQPASALR
ncbi:prolyl oligopeptidase family serine peptidase [Sphingosinicella ginsenosidimutans]|uniref:prolyl oligopeptidase family serine peptidase n=1 Tax=Allosphingosinicella ginsenosidimutans TaxID=1176539 RepID=UPI00131577BB|nr:prolyl oligopeptidase family serine peptidase [Sphingosinicella ginsenosidimutans]